MAWQWNEKVHRYQDVASKRFLAASSLVELRDHYLDMQRQIMADLTSRVVSGDITIAEWERGMRVASKAIFVTSYAYGRGGRNAMTAQDRVQLEELITRQWQYANGFARDLEAGMMTAAQIEARARLYANAGVLANEYGAAATYGGQAAAQTEEHNQLGSLDSCGECPALSALGWVPFGTLKLPGTRVCKANCRCSISRRSRGSAAQESQRLRVVA